MTTGWLMEERQFSSCAASKMLWRTHAGCSFIYKKNDSAVPFHIHTFPVNPGSHTLTIHRMKNKYARVWSFVGFIHQFTLFSWVLQMRLAKLNLKWDFKKYHLPKFTEMLEEIFNFLFNSMYKTYVYELEFIFYQKNHERWRKFYFRWHLNFDPMIQQ